MGGGGRKHTRTPSLSSRRGMGEWLLKLRVYTTLISTTEQLLIYILV